MLNKREKFVEVKIDIMAFLPNHMRFLVVRESDWIPFWPVVGKFNIREMEAKGVEVIKYKGYKYAHAVKYLGFLRDTKPKDFFIPLYKLHLDTFFMNEDKIMKEEDKYILVLVSPTECNLEKYNEGNIVEDNNQGR